VKLMAAVDQRGGRLYGTPTCSPVGFELMPRNVGLFPQHLAGSSRCASRSRADDVMRYSTSSIRPQDYIYSYIRHFSVRLLFTPEVVGESRSPMNPRLGVVAYRESTLDAAHAADLRPPGTSSITCSDRVAHGHDDGRTHGCTTICKTPHDADHRRLLCVDSADGNHSYHSGAEVNVSLDAGAIGERRGGDGGGGRGEGGGKGR